MFDLNGKVAIVTGGARGIGRATALTLAGQGAALVVTDLDRPGAEETAALIAKTGAEALALRHDVASSDDWALVIGAVRQRWGRVDALVNNAGIMIPTPFREATIAEFDRSIAVNAASVFLGSQAVVPLMVATAETFGARPSIVNLSSIYGAFAGPAHVTYSASKGAVRAMSKGMAIELARHGIRVNTVFPGPVNTDLMTNAVKTLAGYGLRAAGEEGLAAVARAHPMGRSAEPDDIAGVITFLCSDAASFMTGGELTVDGGLTLA